jgi:hypothetical protein
MSDSNAKTIEKLNQIKYKLNKYINLKENNKVIIFRFFFFLKKRNMNNHLYL